MYLVMFSTLLCISSSSWMMIWILTEINTMLMCTIICKESKLNKMSNKPALQYFIPQILSSIMFISSVILMNYASFIMKILFFMSLLMKMGAWPSHLWYLKLLTILPMKKSMMMIMTWQKIIPLFILNFMEFSFLFFWFLFFVSMMSMTPPVYLLRKLSNFKSIIILSSLQNNGWILISIMCSVKLIIMYLLIYSLSMILMILWMNKNNMKENISYSMEQLMLMSNIMSTPLTPMFLSKMVIIFFFIKNFFSKELMIIMMILSFIFCFFYLISSFKNVMFQPLKNQFFIKKKMKSGFYSMVSLYAIPLFMMLLDLTQNGAYFDSMKSYSLILMS